MFNCIIHSGKCYVQLHNLAIVHIIVITENMVIGRVVNFCSETFVFDHFMDGAFFIYEQST